MADITAAVNKIKTATMGQDVRTGIADAMSAVNADNVQVISLLGDLDPLEVAAAAVTATTKAGIAVDSAADAMDSEVAAATAKTAAQTAKTAAELAETHAKTSETNSKASETASKASETAAAGSAGVATTKAGESAASAADALAAKNLAEAAKTQTQSIKDAAVAAMAGTTNLTEINDARRGKASLGQKIDEIDSQLAEKAKQTDLVVERNRITNLATLAAGSTTGDAELLDGRVGVDGKIYGNIGSANRYQFMDLIDYMPINEYTEHEGYAISSGYSQILSLANYSVAEYSLKAGRKYIITAKDNSILKIALTNNAFAGVATTSVAEVITSGDLNRYEYINTNNYKYLYVSIKTPDKPSASQKVRTTFTSDVIRLMSKEEVFPEDFGAFGNGTSDDTSALQNAINYCITNGKTLRGIKGKVYAISDTLTITNLQKLCVDMNMSVIKAIGSTLTQYKPMLSINKTDNTDINTVNVFDKIVLDCNSLCSGISFTYGYKFVFNTLSIRQCKGIGMSFGIEGGGECYFNNVHITCLHSGIPATISTGLQLQTSDLHFSNCVIIDADRAVYNAGSNMFDKLHAWNTASCTGTIFFEHNAGYPMLSECHCDTYEIGYLRETDRPLFLNNCVYYINSNLYDSLNTPVIFKIEDTAKAFSGNVKCTNCEFDSLNTVVNFSNRTHKIQQINCSYKGTINSYSPIYAMSLLNNASASGQTTNKNEVKQSGDFVEINLDLNATNCVIGTTDLTIGQIEDYSYMRPDAWIIESCKLFMDEWSTTYTNGYISINPTNGVVAIKANAAASYKKLKAKFSYEKKLGIYTG